MSPLAKSAATLAAVFVLAAIGLAIRYEVVQGLFTGITPVTPGVCRAIASGLQGPSDFAIDAAHNAIFVSSRNRGAGRADSDPHDGLYLLKLNDPSAAAVKLTGMPTDFHPDGLTLSRTPDGNETLLVIDHAHSGAQVAVILSLTYDGDTPKLSQQTAVQSRQLTDPYDLAAVGPNQFYVTNAHATTGKLGRFAEDYLLWPHADVLLFNGMGFRIPVQRIALPDGILATNGFLYVAAGNERRLLAFSREDFTGNLTEVGALSLPAKLGHISIDKGDLIVAGQSKPGSAQVFRVHLDGKGIPQSYDTIFSDDGHMLNGASAAAIQGGHLFIGSARDSKMLVCDIN
jgi:arylesterase/paraoxonase